MIKTKWLDIRLPCDLNEFAQKIQGHSYIRGKECGVDLTDFNEHQLSGRFIQEIIEKEIRKDPFGEEFTIESKRYIVFGFACIRVRHDQYLLRLDSPPRTVKKFFETLYSAVGFGIFISPVEINVPVFIDSIKKTNGINQLRVTRVRANGLALAGRATAKIEVISQSDALTDLTEAFYIEKTQVEKAYVSFVSELEARKMEVTQIGIIAVEEDMVDAATDMFFTFYKKIL